MKNNSNFNKEKSAAYTTSLQSEEIYDYTLNLIAPHTYDECYDPWPEGIHLTLTTTCNIPHVIEVYEQDKKEMSGHGLHPVHQVHFGNGNSQMGLLQYTHKSFESWNYRHCKYNIQR